MGNQVAATKKVTDSGSCDYAIWASSCMQGWRAEMEDVHLSMARLFEPCNSPPPYQPPQGGGRRAGPAHTLSPLRKSGSPEGSLFCASPISFFGVFDGHGGSVVPAFVGATLPTELARELSKQSRAKFVAEKRQEASSNAKTRIFLRQKKVSAAAAAAVREDVEIPQFVSRALRNAFVETDWKAIDDIPNDALSSGTTTVVALIVAADRPKVVASEQSFAADGSLLPEGVAPPPIDSAQARQQPIFGNSKRGAWGLLWVANSGDSRAVLSREGVAIAMSDDHKPWLEDELARIEAAGHNLTNNRVDGGINLSRGIGDWRYKTKASKPESCAVTCVPDVRRRTLARGDEFLVLGCDGIWDRMTNQQMCNFVRLRLMPRSHWSETELQMDQGINSKFYDPYTEYENAVKEKLKSRKARKEKETKEKETKEKETKEEKEEKSKSKSKSKSKKKDADEEGGHDGDEEDEDCISVDYQRTTKDTDDEELDELTKHHKEIMDKVCEPKSEFERYKLWPGDPGVCGSVEELLTMIAKHICNNCLSSDGEASAYGTDNMTVTIILFPNSKLGRAVYKRYPHSKREGSAAPSEGTESRRRSCSSGAESDSAVQRPRSESSEFRGSSSGSPGTAGVIPNKIILSANPGPSSDAADSASSTPPTDGAKKAKSKHKKHTHRHNKVDLTAPMSDAEKIVYQFADDFSDDDRFVFPPEPSTTSFK